MGGRHVVAYVSKAATATWALLKDTVEGFVDDGGLSWGASIAYYTLFSIAPVLLIVIAIAGLAFGHEAAQGAIVRELSGLMGRDTAKALQAMVESANNRVTGRVVSLVGIFVVIVAVTGVFGEVQTALNVIWKVRSDRPALTRFMRARLASMGLVVTSGFLLTVSLATSAALAALSDFLSAVYPTAVVLLHVGDFLISGLLISGLFAAMYKVLPDVPLAWRDVGIGAVATTLLFEGGKYVIALYVGKSNIASSYGAAGALIVLLVWIYYSAQIFLLGAEFTRAFARRYGSHTERSQSERGRAEQAGR